MERRELIRWLVATAGFPGLALGREVHRQPARHPPSPVDRLVAVAAERILPGATEADVSAFIDKMLADWHTPEERARVLGGLAGLEARGFSGRSETEQVAMLTALDNESFAADDHDHWFARFKYLTVYGYCTSEIGMKALGLYPLPWRYDGCAPV
ncbi:MAG: gluconate 2-dehydrogenase subunit 3 family protein [Gemmatimonadales bacterium]